MENLKLNEVLEKIIDKMKAHFNEDDEEVDFVSFQNMTISGSIVSDKFVGIEEQYDRWQMFLEILDDKEAEKYLTVVGFFTKKDIEDLYSDETWGGWED